MRGASRAALAQAWTGVEQLLGAASGSAASVDAAVVGDELFAVLDLVDTQVALRRALSDPAVEPDRKAALVDSVLASRVSAATLGIVGDLVRSRWSRMRDLPDSIEILAVLAELIAAAAAGHADDVEDELFRFGRIVESRPQLREALSNPALPDANKVSLVSALLTGKATAETIRLITQLALHPRGRAPEATIAEYGDIAASRRNRLVARVTAAISLSDAECDRLRAALAQIYGHDVHLEVEVDEQIVGGIVVQVGDEVLDGSIIGRLAEARQRLE
jgi:F-type H+-transporting ATPase subunit delta